MFGGTAYGGVVLSRGIAAPMEIPVSKIAVMDDDGNGFTLSRDQAHELIEALRACLHDA